MPMNTTTCRYYRTGEETDLSIVLLRESVRRGAGAPPWPVLERLDLTGLWLPVSAETEGRDGFVALAGLEPIDLDEAAELYLQLGQLRLIPPTTPLPDDLAAAVGIDTDDGRQVASWLMVFMAGSGTIVVLVTVLLALVLLILALT